MREREDFSQCLVDGDKQSLARSRWIRREALLVSIILEAALVAAMFLLPLITPGLPPQRFLITPAPPYHGGSSSAPAGPRSAPHRQPNETSVTTYNVMSLHTAHIQTHAAAVSSEDAPSIGTGFGPSGSLGSGTGGGEDIPGGIGPRPIPEPPKPKAEKPRPMSEGVMEAALLNKVQPQYPPAGALDAHSGCRPPTGNHWKRRARARCASPQRPPASGPGGFGCGARMALSAHGTESRNRGS
jgi:hypothetical protein